VAQDDPARAVAILRRVSDRYWRYDWLREPAPTAGHPRRHADAMIDLTARVLLKAEMDDFVAAVQFHKLAVAAARVNPRRAEKVVDWITNTDVQVRTLIAMAEEIASADGVSAAVWLSEALTRAGRSRELQSQIGAAAIEVHPPLSRHARHLIVERVRPGAPAHELIDFARCLAPIDPLHAEQLLARALQEGSADVVTTAGVLVDIAEAFSSGDPDRALRTLDDVEIPFGSHADRVRLRAATVLVRIAAALAVWDAGKATGVLQRAQRELHAIRSKDLEAPLAEAWRALADVLVQLDPAVAGRLAAQLKDLNQDELLAALATVDPAGAERIARAITDRTRRNEALAALAISLVSSAGSTPT
jgi:hypothetical protein